MADWLNTPTIIIAVVALFGLGTSILGLVWKVSKWTGSVDDDRTSFKKFMEKIDNNIEKIHEDIQRIFQRLGPSPTGASSPIELTEYGEELSKKLNARNWASQTALTIQADVSEKEPFQVHEFCKGYVGQISVETHPEVFKLAYENGISDENMRSVLTIVLRDELLGNLR